MKLELLKDDPDLDIFHNLWQQSFNIRRLCIHDLIVTEILERFPGYRLSEMNVKISYLFILDVLPIRVIRILCKFFGDPVGNVFTHGVVDESLEQVKQNQYSSSNFNLTRSTNIDQQSLNQHMDDDLNQASNSDDEELKPLSIASPFSMPQCSSPLIIQNQTTSSFTIEDHSNNIYSEKTREFYHSDKPLSKEQGEDEPDTYTEGKELHSAAIKRKRKKQTSSSSITTTAKHFARLVVKRI
ncbi:unnamed protein product [Rotaria sp. Silwood2]|nr:unnamed protein product [Rotaria sp. Silwood2]CAF4420374.1 unnamed protein product [Rotaria sp. Silwood2]